MTGLELRVVPAAQFAVTAADIIADTIRAKPDAVIGLPTGNTPMPVYHELIARRRKGEMDFGRLRVVVLDDYYGVEADSPISFFNWLRREFIDPASIGSNRVLRIPSEAADVDRACAEYEQRLHALGGCDLQILGLGANGHIGFNEPGSSRTSHTRVVRLAKTSLEASERYWGHRPTPDRGITMGIGTILEARCILLLVNGAAKAEILRRTLEGPIGAEVPASFLREARSGIVLADEPAAALLKTTSCTAEDAESAKKS